jgi:hypothetical protein
MAVKPGTEINQIKHVRGTVVDHDFNRRASAEAGAGRKGVLVMQGGTIVVPKRGGNAALGVLGIALVSELFGQDGDFAKTA